MARRGSWSTPRLPSTTWQTRAANRIAYVVRRAKQRVTLRRRQCAIADESLYLTVEVSKFVARYVHLVLIDRVKRCLKLAEQSLSLCSGQVWNAIDEIHHVLNHRLRCQNRDCEGARRRIAMDVRDGPSDRCGPNREDRPAVEIRRWRRRLRLTLYSTIISNHWRRECCYCTGGATRFNRDIGRTANRRRCVIDNRNDLLGRRSIAVSIGR